jgi:transcriptional regulator with XRE-family HTH domain
MSLHQHEPAAEDMDVRIGELVHQRMWKLRMTGLRLAEEMGVDQSGLSKRLRGERTWTAANLRDVARALGTSVAYLMGEVDDVEWAPSGSNRRPRDYKVVTSDALVTPIDWIFERRELAAS